MIWQIEQRVDLCDGHPLLRLSHLHDFVGGSHLALSQDATVEARPSAGCQQSRHPRLVHPNADAITGNARLADLEQGAADLVAVADAHCVVGQSFDREVLAELSMDEVGPLQLLLPIAIRFDLIDEDGALLTPVPSQVALTVSVQIHPADPTAARHRILPDPGVHSATLPLDVTRKSDVHGQESSHVALGALAAAMATQPVGARSWLFEGEHLRNGEAAIGAVRHDRLARLKTELGPVELYRDNIRLE